MKRFFGLLLILALWAGSSSQATDSTITDVVRQSLRTGSAQELAAHFDTNIELIIDTEAIEFPSVDATHAEIILKSFFRKHPPRRFQYVHQGTSEHQHYSTGTYQTNREKFQVYVVLKEATDSNGQYAEVGPHQYLINTLHFRKVN